MLSRICASLRVQRPNVLGAAFSPTEQTTVSLSRRCFKGLADAQSEQAGGSLKRFKEAAMPYEEFCIKEMESFARYQKMQGGDREKHTKEQCRRNYEQHCRLMYDHYLRMKQ